MTYDFTINIFLVIMTTAMSTSITVIYYSYDFYCSYSCLCAGNDLASGFVLVALYRLFCTVHDFLAACFVFRQSRDIQRLVRQSFGIKGLPPALRLLPNMMKRCPMF